MCISCDYSNSFVMKNDLFCIFSSMCTSISTYYTCYIIYLLLLTGIIKRYRAIVGIFFNLSFGNRFTSLVIIVLIGENVYRMLPYRYTYIVRPIFKSQRVLIHRFVDGHSYNSMWEYWYDTQRMELPNKLVA